MSELPDKLRPTLALITRLQVEAGWQPIRIPAAQGMTALRCSASTWRRRIHQLVALGWLAREPGPGRGHSSRYAVRWDRRRPWFNAAGPHGARGEPAPPGATTGHETKAPDPPAGLPEDLQAYLLSWRERDPHYYAQLLQIYQGG